MLKAPRFALRSVRLAVRSVRAASSSSTSQAAPALGLAAGAKPSWQVRVLYDSDCPLCMREIDMLRARDTGHGKIDFVDIAAPSYSPADNAGITFEQAMDRIHAIKADGTVLKDVEVFRELYEAVGLGWVYAATKNETVLKAANAVYSVWAKYRLQVTGRPPLEEVLLQKKRTCRDENGNTSCDL